MSSVNTSGSITTDGTEQTLATVTTASNFVIAIDLANMAAGDEIEMCIYGKARSGDGERLLHLWPILGNQSRDLWQSIPVASPHHLKATIRRHAGTDRAYPWAIYDLA